MVVGSRSLIWGVRPGGWGLAWFGVAVVEGRVGEEGVEGVSGGGEGACWGQGEGRQDGCGDGLIPVILRDHKGIDVETRVQSLRRDVVHKLWRKGKCWESLPLFGSPLLPRLNACGCRG